MTETEGREPLTAGDNGPGVCKGKREPLEWDAWSRVGKIGSSEVVGVGERELGKRELGLWEVGLWKLGLGGNGLVGVGVMRNRGVKVRVWKLGLWQLGL